MIHNSSVKEARICTKNDSRTNWQKNAETGIKLSRKRYFHIWYSVFG